jgi:predicted nuclease with TOPRIM domain
MRNKLFFAAFFTLILIPSAALSQNNNILMHVRIYLSSIISDAESISVVSPLAEEDIRAYGIDLMQSMDKIENAESTEKFLGKFEDVFYKIFTDKDLVNLESFRKDMTSALADLDDALSILTSGNDRKNLRSDLAEIQSKLQMVSEEKGLTEWINMFDLFTAKLLTHALTTDIEILVQDAHALLDNLSSYTSQLESSNIDTGDLKDEISELREMLENVSEEEDFDKFIESLEEVLISVPKTQ